MQYQNVIIGRYSNRVPTGDFELSKDGASATLKSLPNEAPEVSLHGGPSGFDQEEWESVPLRDADPTLFSTAERATLAGLGENTAALFKLTSKDGDQGFPGTLEVQVLFAVVEATGNTPGPDAKELALGSLAIVYRAKVIPGASGKKIVTPVNLTQVCSFHSVACHV